MRHALPAILVAGMFGCAATPGKMGCGANGENAKQETRSMQANSTDIETLKGLIGMELHAFTSRNGISPDHVRNQAVFEKLTGLTEVHDSAVSPWRFYFKDGKLALVYLEGGPLGSLDPKALEAKLGAGGIRLRSRAGKASNLMVYADKGVAASLSDEVDFIQIFRPRTHQEYLSTIYEDPGSFPL